MALFGAFYGLDQRWAKAASVEQLSVRLEQKIIQDQMFAIQERIWKLEDRYKRPGMVCPPEIENEIRNLRQDLKMLELRLKRL
jgi:hypothetical protein